MTALDEVKKAKQQGLSEDKIVQMLRDKGVQYKEIAEALAQARIQDAVELPDENPGDAQQAQEYAPQYQQEYTPSVQEQAQAYMTPAPTEMAAPAPSQGQEYSYAQPYGQYAPQESESSLLNEIAEQVVTEKLDDTRKQIEKISDLRSHIQARVESLDDRLKRIEKIIDTLQSSVLKKVGDYVTNVEDIKQELIETQKTFSSLAEKSKHKKK